MTRQRAAFAAEGFDRGSGQALHVAAPGHARAIVYAVEQPADVDINEIVILPVSQES